jgi:hypothetical protein
MRERLHSCDSVGGYKSESPWNHFFAYLIQERQLDRIVNKLIETDLFLNLA